MQLVRKLVEFHPYGPALKGSGDERAKATKLLNEIQESSFGVRLDGWMVGWLEGWMVVVTRCLRRFEGLLVVGSFACILSINFRVGFCSSSERILIGSLNLSAAAPPIVLWLAMPPPSPATSVELPTLPNLREWTQEWAGKDGPTEILVPGTLLHFMLDMVDLRPVIHLMQGGTARSSCGS